MSCSYRINPEFRQFYTVESVNDLKGLRTQNIKIHYRDGRLAVLDQLQVNEDNTAFSSEGKIYDQKRGVISEGIIDVAFEDIALIETNDYRRIQGQYIGIAVLGQVAMLITNIWLTIYCINNNCGFS